MRINALGNTATDFASDDYLVIDGTTYGSRKINKNSLLSITNQSALNAGISKEFDPTRDEDSKYKTFEMCSKNGKTYMFTNDHYGVWNIADVQEIHVSDSLFSLLKSTTNLKFYSDLNGFTELTNYLLSANGTTFNGCKTSSSGWRCYYKSVNAGEIYHIKATCGQLARLWFFFDENGNKVAMYDDSLDLNTQKQREAVIVIPDGVYTLGINRKYGAGNQNDPFVIEKYTEELEVSVFDVDTDFFVSSKNNILKKNTFSKEIGLAPVFAGDNSNWTMVNHKLLSSLGTSIATCEADASNWRYYYKSVNPNEIYYLDSFCGQLARLWFFFDENGDKVAQYTDDVDPNTQKERTDTIIIPEGVTTLAVNCGQYNGVFFDPTFKKRILTIPYSHITDFPEDVVTGDKLYGKTIAFCGDSITEGGAIGDDGTTDRPTIDVYQRIKSDLSFVHKTSAVNLAFGYQIASRHNMVYYNDGLSGSTMQDIASKYGFSASGGRYTSLPNDLDYIVIFFGWNDTAYGSLGSISDGTNNSYYGGYNVVLPYLINKYPYAKICLVVPYGTDEGHRNAIRLLANKWGVSVFDMYGAGTPLFYGKEASVGVDPSLIAPNKAKFTTDNTHPNVYGHKQIADMLELHLMGI